jgi:glutathione S-transferase
MPAFTLYTAPKASGRKVSIALEEMALPYEINVFLPCFPENIQPAVDRYTIGRPWH